MANEGYIKKNLTSIKIGGDTIQDTEYNIVATSSQFATSAKNVDWNNIKNKPDMVYSANLAELSGTQSGAIVAGNALYQISMALKSLINSGVSSIDWDNLKNRPEIISELEKLEDLSGDYKDSLLNGNALSNLVSALQDEIKKAQEGAILSQDLMTTTAWGYIPKKTTLSAGTLLEDIIVSALRNYVAPQQATLSISPSTTLYAYPNTATITGVTANFKVGTDPITSYAIIDTQNSGTTAASGLDNTFSVTSSVNIEINNNTTLKISASDGKSTVTGSKTISFAWPYISGYCSEQDNFDLNADASAGFTKLESSYKDQVVNYTPDSTTGSYYYLAYPNNYPDINMIKDSGGDGDTVTDSFIKTSGNYSTTSYKVYVIDHLVTSQQSLKFYHK